MKKLIVITLALVLCLSLLASCGEKKKEPVDVNPLEQTEEFITDANGNLSVLLPIEDHEGKWSYSSVDASSVVEKIKEEQIEGDDGVLRQYYVFSSVAEEYTEINMNFSYASGEDGAAEKGYNVKVLVPGDGMVLVSEVTDYVPAEESTTESDENMSVTEDGKLVVSLESNPSTGYHWEYAIDDESIIKFVSEESVSTTDDEEIVGAPEIWKATFEGIATDGAPHPAVITFTYVAPDGTASDTTYSASFLVLPDGTIVV